MDLKEQGSAQYYGILYICNILETCKLIQWIIIICPRIWYVIVFKNKKNKAQHLKQELRRDTSRLPGKKKSTGAS